MTLSLPRTPSFRLDGRRALVTGASSGIGLGCAVAMAEAGAHTILAARRKAELDQAVEAIRASGGSAEAVVLDVSDVDAIVAEKGGLTLTDQADLAASFQAAVVDVLAEKTRRAFAAVEGTAPGTLCVAGGVAANQAIRAALETVSREFGAHFVAPPLALCTDNAAMIAYAALEQSALRAPDDLSLSARPRWPLDQSQPAMLGSGKKGAKA